jgi:hypothetical protein
VFGDRGSGACLVKFSSTAIERHAPVKGSALPDDPAQAAFWASRRKIAKPPPDRYTLRLRSRLIAHGPGDCSCISGPRLGRTGTSRAEEKKRKGCPGRG